jgi:3-hydroxyisobutyrate dehydrogenase-like beta-hydroxyacid dehydrogenase
MSQPTFVSVPGAGGNGHPQRECVGLIGVGLMGSALAERLIAGGLRVVGYDIRKSRCRLLEEMGGESAADSPAVAALCDRILLSLPDSSVVEEVLAEIGGGLRAGQVIIDTSTGEPARAASLGERLGRAGVAYLDATVSGSSAQVRTREVTAMVGGDRLAFDRCRDLLELFARNAFWVGPCGSGSTMKLVTNLVLGLNRAALAEGLTFARSLGLDPAQTLDLLRESMAYSRIMDTKGQKMVSGEFEAQARLSQHLKDVRLILEAGEQSGAELPLSRTHRELLELAESAGLGQLDNSAIIRVFEQGLIDSAEKQT